MKYPEAVSRLRAIAAMRVAGTLTEAVAFVQTLDVLTLYIGVEGITAGVNGVEEALGLRQRIRQEIIAKGSGDVPHICATCEARGLCPVTETPEPCVTWKART